MHTLNLHSVLCQLYLNKNNFLRILMYSRVVRSEAVGLRWGEVAHETSLN